MRRLNEVDITRQTYDEIADDYARSLKDPYLRGSAAYHKEAMERFVALMPPQRCWVLDLGCGFGHDLSSFLERGLNTVGIDLSKGMLALARQRFPMAELCHMDMRRLYLKPGSFGGVWAAHCLYHVPKRDIGKVIAGIKRVLVPGGSFFCSLKLGEGEGMYTQGQAVSYPGKPRFYALYTEAEAREMLKDFDIVGWDIQTKIYYGSGWVYIWAKKPMSSKKEQSGH